MGIERERRWLVNPADVPVGLLNSTGLFIRQGYLSGLGVMPVVRIRLQHEEGKAHKAQAIQTVKGLTPDNDGVKEVEFDIPLDAGEALMSMSGAKLVKTRKITPIWLEHGTVEGKIELDLFRGSLDGKLVIAEIEVPFYEAQLEVPAWLGPEIQRDVKGLSNVDIAFAPNSALDKAAELWKAWRSQK